MSVSDKFESLKSILQFVLKVVTIADKLVDFIIKNIETKGV